MLHAMSHDMSKGDTRSAIAGVLLAGGDSSRLGASKQLVEFAGEPLILRAARAATELCTAGLVVVTGAVHEPIEAALAGTSVTVARNPEWREGIGASIRCGVCATDARADAFLLLLCDQPWVGSEELAELIAAWRAAPDSIAAAGYAGCHGVPAVFPARFRQRLIDLSGDRGARALIDAADDLTVVDMPAAAFDIDTPEDVQRISHARPEHGSD